METQMSSEMNDHDLYDVCPTCNGSGSIKYEKEDIGRSVDAQRRSGVLPTRSEASPPTCDKSPAPQPKLVVLDGNHPPAIVSKLVTLEASVYVHCAGRLPYRFRLNGEGERPDIRLAVVDAEFAPVAQPVAWPEGAVFTDMEDGFYDEQAEPLKAAPIAAQPVARAHISMEDDGLRAELEVLNGAALQPEMSPVDLYVAPVAAQAQTVDDKYIALRDDGRKA